MTELDHLRDFIDFLGRKWVFEIIQQLQGKRLRFSEIKDEIEGISNKMLSERLKDLYNRKLIVKIVISLVPLNVKYALSEYGLYLTQYCAKLEHELKHHPVW